MRDKDYYLGLDMGTSSLGWAVTDENYNLLRAKGKDLWGIREFEEALTAVDRRTSRVARRRRQREAARIGLLQEYFHDAICAVDANFYQRLNNSKYHREDKDREVNSPDGIFHDKDYTDKHYFEQYPTIFHLRAELLESDEPHDVRLVYLALLNMFKHRGHFLNMTLETDGSVRKIGEAYEDFCSIASELLELEFLRTVDGSALEEILSNRDFSRKRKAEELAALLCVAKKEKKKMACINGICGLKFDLKVVFGEELAVEDKKYDVSFSESQYEEKEAEMQGLLTDEAFELIGLMKEIYDIGSLAGIMKGHNYLSQARVAEYEKHKTDLKILKSLVKKYATPEEYNQFFREPNEGTYSAYVNSSNSAGMEKPSRRDMKGRKPEDLYASVKKLLKKMPAEDAQVSYVLAEIEKEHFLPKQLTASNGVIPNQVHAREMRKILSHAEQYLPFLKERDDSGLTVSERILKLFSFQIPYYVGPVTVNSAKNNGNGWVVRREEGRVLPWNIEQKIDMKATSQKFIENLVRRCTYISDQKVLPKSSLMYERFCVLNEINNIKVRDEKISVVCKQALYRELFAAGKKVTKKKICAFLRKEGLIKEGEEEQVSGIDVTLNNSLSSYAKFRQIFGEEIDTDDGQKMAEQIIFWCTVYGDARHFLKESLEEQYSDRLSEEQIKRILGFKFKDWGNLSKEFLTLDGCSKETGERMPLIHMMWESNDNLMELLAENRYTYKESLEEMQNTAVKSLAEMRPEDLDDMYFSAPVKRMVWQTLLLIREIEKIMGRPPKRLFVEMTRKEDEKKRTTSRKQQLLDLYRSIRDESHDWKDLIERSEMDGTLRSKKMYLYLTQMGKCMYTGKPIDLNDLFDNNLYDIDHIYPRHFVKDDNLANNLVLVDKRVNAHKSDTYPLEEDIYKKCYSLWKALREKGLIGEEKFRRLTGRNPFTDEQKAGFIARQLVETSQGTKGVTTILREALPDTELVFSKASNVSDFRRQFKLLKTRLVNDFHHAHDAYLNIVVGNAYYVKFTQNPLNFIKKEYLRNEKENHYNLSRMFDWNIRRGEEMAWVAQKGKEESGTIVTVRKMMEKNTPLLTRLNFEGHGGLAEQTLYSAKKAAKGKEGAYIPLKSSDERMLDVKKYGGFSSAATAYFFLVEHEVKGRKVRTIETLPIFWKTRVEQDEKALQEYCVAELKLKNPLVRVKKIKIQSLIKRDGYYMHLSGKTNNQLTVRNAVQLCLKQKWMDYIKCLEKEEVTDKITREDNIVLYDILAQKHTETIYANKPNPMGNKLMDGREKFLMLEIQDQRQLLLELLKLTIIGNTMADLTLIGGAQKAGVTLIGKDITALNEFTLINQSITGIYENEIDLLTV